jgi:S-methylmethionine-dependent homocysteine/selenocysteine methylase
MAENILPQMQRTFLTDAGLETDILFNRGIDLPHFASITLLQSAEGRAALTDYYRGFLKLAARATTGVILETATWRASSDWAEPLGMTPEELAVLNQDAVALLLALKDEFRARIADIVVSGCIGPRGDGYDPGRIMSVGEARDYHGAQMAELHGAGCEMVCALTMTNVPEAIGMVEAAASLGTPIAISFTVETDGRLPTGDSLADAIKAVDNATGASAAYFMINCAHPTHFGSTLVTMPADISARISGIRANASRCSHAELDAMTELDRGDPVELATQYRGLITEFPQLTVLGGCCGTDLAHIDAIADACLAR